MRMRDLSAIGFAILIVTASIVPTAGVGRPGLTPVACPTMAWEATDPAFEALPGAKAFSGKYEGGLYRIEIPDKWNGELMLSSHGYVAAGAGRGQQLRAGNPAFRQHLIDEGFAWASSSYRCNGYIPGIGLTDTMALTDLFTKFNSGRAPQRHWPPAREEMNAMRPFGSQHGSKSFHGPSESWARPVPSVRALNTW